MRRDRNKSGSKILFLLFLSLFIGGGIYLFNSPYLEGESPKIEAPGKIYSNLKKGITVSISDNIGVKFVRVLLSDGKNEILLNKKIYDTPQKSINYTINFPKNSLFLNSKKLLLKIIAEDDSKLNMLSGNKTQKDILVIIDKKRPTISVINNSYSIRKGGVATVIFYAKDDNLNELYIRTNFKKRFKPTPFYKDDYYISLIAWPITQKSFKAKLVAIDKAGNKTTETIHLYLKSKRYKTSHINLNDKFLDGKIVDLINEIGEDPNSMERLERFKFINETIRDENERTIEKITSNVPNETIDSFDLKPFYPLKNGAAVASFGDHRFYSYKKKRVSESYHMGLDLASVAFANIKSSNDGEVVYARFNGIYGNNIIIHHGLGFYTLYGHCSKILVKEGDIIKRGEVIAKSGMTGLALGDHLHFGTLVQGEEVRPEEWMDRKWLKLNVQDIIKNGKKLIDKMEK